MKRIAILEDDKDYREVLMNILKGAGYEVYGEESGYDIVKSVVDNKPDLIILDLMLPMIDGEQVMEVFKNKGVLSSDEMPVVVLSSKDESEIKRAAEKVGASAWMKKPVEKEELLDTVRKHIG